MAPYIHHRPAVKPFKSANPKFICHGFCFKSLASKVQVCDKVKTVTNWAFLRALTRVYQFSPRTCIVSGFAAGKYFETSPKLEMEFCHCHMTLKSLMSS